MSLTYGARAPSLWQDNPAGINGACPGAAALMTLLELFRRGHDPQTLVEITHTLLDMFGNDIFGMMGIVIVSTVWGSSVVFCLPAFEKE